MVPETILHYVLISKLGAGGMGEVYLAEDTRLDRKVALKLLPALFTQDSERLRRFVQEAKAASALNHPNILTIHEIGEIDGMHYIATEYIEGETLRHHIQHSRMRTGEVLDIVVQVGSALSTAHQAGIIHRDIKPENLMIRPDGIVKMLDFGLAKLTEKPTSTTDTEAATLSRKATDPGTIMGTVQYMSPEQARGKTVDARTDVFSLGILLYEMISGRPPFTGETSTDVLAAILDREPLPLLRFADDVPMELQRIVTKCLRKDRDERYQMMKDLLLDLKDLREELALEAKTERSLSASSRSSENQQTLIAAGERTNDQTAQVANSPTSQTGSSAEYIVSEIKQHKMGSAVALLILLLAAIGVVYWYSSNRSSITNEIESIAVMPFINETGDAEGEYLSDGMTEMLIGSLSQLPKLNVKARSSVFRYKGKETDARTIGKELNLQAILTGRIVQHGNDLTLYIELVDAGTENVLWKETYARPMTNFATMQSEIARDVSEKLRPRLSGADKRRVTKDYTANSAAYQLYLKGRFYTLQYTPEAHKKAIEHLNESIRSEPNFALAWAGLADAYTAAADWLVPPREALEKARAAAERALSLDETLAEAHAALGHVLVHQFDPAAERELQRALELNPNSVEARLWYGEYFIGRDEAKGIAVLHRAQELDPLSPVIGQFILAHYFFNRHFDEALIEAQKTLQLDPNDPNSRSYLAFVYAAKGNHAQAIAILENLRQELPTSQTLGFLGMEYALTGRRNEALNIIVAINELSKQHYISPYDIAVVYTGLGDREQALAWLKKAREDQCEWTGWLRFDYRFDSMRSDPRFQELCNPERQTL